MLTVFQENSTATNFAIPKIVPPHDNWFKCVVDLAICPVPNATDVRWAGMVSGITEFTTKYELPNTPDEAGASKNSAQLVRCVLRSWHPYGWIVMQKNIVTVAG